jgi:hypothetical protein
MSETKMTKRDAKKYAAGLASKHLSSLLKDFEERGPTSTRTHCDEDHRKVLDALFDISAELSRRSMRGK